MRRRTALLAISMLPLCGVTACGGATRTSISGSLAETFETLEELTDAAEIIAEGQAVSPDVDRSDGPPWTLSVVALSRI